MKPMRNLEERVLAMRTICGTHVSRFYGINLVYLVEYVTCAKVNYM